MKNFIVLLCLTGFMVKSYAQEHESEKFKAMPKQKVAEELPDSVSNLPQSKLNFMNRQNDRNDMPVVKPKLHGKYLGNNGNGSDVYAMMPYNMPCLVPDSSFYSNMPAKRFSIKNQKGIDLKRENDNRTPDN